MALKKQIETVYGVSAEYWRILSWSIDVMSKKVHIIIAPYINESVRRDDGMPIMDNAVSIYCIDKSPTLAGAISIPETDVYDTYFSPAVLDRINEIQAMYVFIKEKVPYFDGSEDC